MSQKTNEEVKRLETEVEKLKRKLLVVERLRFEKIKDFKQKQDNSSLLAAGVAHEFNNILGSLEGHSLFALDMDKKEEMKEALNTVLYACKRSHQITRALQHLGQPREEEKEIVMISEVIEESKKLILSPELKTKVHFEIEVNNMQVYGSRVELVEIFINLAKNAIQASLDGEVSLFIREEKSQDNFNLLSFRDTGPGIPIHLRDQIFRPFFTTKGVMAVAQASEGAATLGQSNPKAEGSGLGLYLCANMLEAMGGSIDLVDPPAGLKGACFSLRFPRLEQ